MLGRLQYSFLRREISPLVWNYVFGKSNKKQLWLPAKNFIHSGTNVYEGTIYALSSGFGKCGVAVIRVSGIESSSALLKLTRLRRTPKPKKVFVSPLWHPETQVMLDRALIFWFAKPKSFTGEDMCEFQVHGGPAVVASVLDALSCIDGLRPANPGDFTKRAFLNNKFDLTEVEGLGDLIHAETEAQRRQALYQMEGSLSSLYKVWTDEVLRLVAHCEAFIDFGEDQHLGSSVLDNVQEQIKNIQQRIEKHLIDSRKGERLRTGVRVCIVGKPNVGKSTFLNCVTQRPAAIVSPIAGTTRDVIETALDISGFPVLLSDTAGLCQSDDIVEKEGIARAYKKVQEADLVILMLSVEMFLNSKLSAPAIIQKQVQDLNIEQYVKGDNLLVIVNKIDTVEDCTKFFLSNVFPMSCTTTEGFMDFLVAFSEKVKTLCGDIPVGNEPSATQQRHRRHLVKCVQHLKKASDFFDDDDIVIAAEYLRMTLRELGQISGKVDPEKILDVIFQDFCIGK